MKDLKLVIVSVNDKDFGVDVSQVKEIIKPIEIFEVPSTPKYFEGLINLRGKVYSIFNLRNKLGLPVRQFDDNTRFIIANETSASKGFIVDGVREIITVEEKNPEDMPPTVSDLTGKYVTKVVKTGNRKIFLLDINKVLSIECVI